MKGNRVNVTTISKLICGEESCLFRYWYSMRHKQPEEISETLRNWKIKHTRMVTDFSMALAKKGGKIKREEWLELPIKEGTLFGSSDIIHENEKEVIVYEFKSGNPSQSHSLQLLIYLWMLNKRGDIKDKGIKGVLCYEGNKIEYTLSDISDEIQLEIERYTKELFKDSPPPKFSGASCRFCNVSCEHKELDSITSK